MSASKTYKPYLGILLAAVTGYGVVKYGMSSDHGHQLQSVVTTSSRDFCAAPADAITLSPSGRYALLQSGQRSQRSVIVEGREVHVLDLDCFSKNRDDPKAQCGKVMFSPRGVRVMGWSRSEDSLYLAEGRRNLLRMTSTDSFKSVHDMAKLSRLTATRMVRTTPTEDRSASEEAIELEQLARSMPAKFEMGEVAGIYAGKDIESTGWVIERDEDLGLRFAYGNADWDARRMFRELPDARLAADAGGSLNMAGLGTWLTVTTTNGLLTEVPLVEPFARPIFTSDTGQLAGFFNRDSVWAVDEWKRQQVSPWKGQGEIQAVALGKDTQVVLKSDVGLLRELQIVRRGTQSRITCAALAGDPAMPLDVKVDYRDLTASGHRLYAVEFLRSHSKGTVVFFPGGPLQSTDDAGYSVRQYLKQGYGVLVVNHSGSLGNGAEVSGRVYRVGLRRAVEDDALAVSNYLRSQRPSRVFVHGESFGALGAIALAKRLDHEEWAGPLVLMAPFLKHQDPKAWIPTDAEQQLVHGVIDPKFQRKVEGALFNESFDAEQTSIVESKPSNIRTLVVLAENDLVSTQAHIPASWYTEELEVGKVPGNHLFVSAMPQTWTLISNWLEKQ